VNIESVGAKLKQIRLERGISLEEVQKKTKIHLNVLRAIEGDSLSGLSPVYLKSFIKIYCQYLGLDSRQYMEEKEQAVKHGINAGLGKKLGEGVKKGEAGIGKEKPVVALRRPLRINKIIIPAVFAVIGLLVIFGLIKVVSLTYHKLSSSKKSAPLLVSAAVENKNRVKAEKNAGNTRQRAVYASLKPRKNSVSGLVLGIFARDRCWVSLKSDGHPVFRGMLAKGRFESWKAEEKFELSLGDAGAVQVQINDQRFPNLGRKGRALKNIIITKDGLKVPR